MASHIALLHRALPVLAGLVLTSCQILNAPPKALPPLDAKAKTEPKKSSLYEWKGADLTGPMAVKIDLSEQKAQFTRGGKPAGWTYVATGTSNHRTPTGSFRVSEKVQDKHSTSWGRVVNSSGNTVSSNAKNGSAAVPKGGRFVGAPMPFWMRVNGAIGMHAGPIPYPGSPASHGCIRLPRDMAEILYGVVVVGTPVRIVP
jgi:lipoprotein-anchoring transpeptidase ErfK/SrfK